MVNATLTEYLEEAKLVRRSVIKVGSTIEEDAEWMRVVVRVYHKTQSISNHFLLICSGSTISIVAPAF